MQESFAFIFTLIVIFHVAGFAWIFLHELGHAVGALAVGFKISSFSTGPFILHLHDNGKYKFKVNFSVLLKYLGRVHPLIYNVHGDDQYNALKKKVMATILAGPLFELTAFLSFIFFLRHFIASNLIHTCLLITIVTLFSMNLFYSQDIRVFLNILKNNVSKDIHIYSWSMYGNSADKSSINFIIGKLLNRAYYSRPSLLNINSTDHLIFCNIFMELYLAGYISYIPENIAAVLHKIKKRVYDLSFFISKINEQHLYLTYKFLACMVVDNEEDKEIIREQFVQLDSYKRTARKREVMYEKKRVEHLLGIKDNSDYLACNKNLGNAFIHDYGFRNINQRINRRVLEVATAR